jgi:hypothetical protein
MNYLQLHNAVLDRLREERITASTIGSDPYYNSIGAHINDAKEQVEQAWQWSMLRQDDTIPIVQGQTLVELPDSYDNQYVIKRITCYESGTNNVASVLRWRSDDQVWYYNLPNTVQQNVPQYYASVYPAAANGNQRIEIFQPPSRAFDLRVNSWHTSDTLESDTDLLKVPSLPVYTLATALASRERGETGAINTGELFGIAQSALSDAIAYDSARYPEELDWVGGNDRAFNTNVRTA